MSIWVANEGFRVGTSLFDQFRGVTRPHTFDVNAASPVDLMSLPGAKLEIARRILREGPYGGVDEVLRVEGATREFHDAIVEGRSAMDRRLADPDVEESLDLRAILLPYVYHALLVWLEAGLLGAVLHALVRPARWWRLVANGLVAALVAFAVGWMAEAPLAPLLVPMAAPGVIAALAALALRRGGREALRVVAAWGAAALPASVFLHPWF